MKFLKIFVGLLIVAGAAAVFILPQKQLARTQNQQTQHSPLPQKKQTYVNFQPISSRSAIVVDAASGEILYEKDPNFRHLPASTTKLMTALVALENCDPQDEITVSFVENEPNDMGLKTGDTITVENLIQGLLIFSANDAAYTLSYSCAKDTSEFIRLMNQKAKSLKMENTHFVNPAGYDDPGQFSTANDLAKLARVAVTNPLIAKTVTIKSTVVADVTGTKTYYLENVNKLLGQVEGLEGVKTGQTQGAQEILVSKATRNGNTIIAVVLGSTDRFGESKNLIEWAYQNYDWPTQ